MLPHSNWAAAHSFPVLRLQLIVPPSPCCHFGIIVSPFEKILNFLNIFWLHNKQQAFLTITHAPIVFQHSTRSSKSSGDRSVLICADITTLPLRSLYATLVASDDVDVAGCGRYAVYSWTAREQGMGFS